MSELFVDRYKTLISLVSDESGRFNPLEINVTENTPREVAEFVQLICMTPVNALSSDNDNAFDKIIPRSVRDASSLADYLSYVRNKTS